MQEMDAWSIFISTGNILDYLRYSAIKNSSDYFQPPKEQDLQNENDTSPKITG